MPVLSMATCERPLKAIQSWSSASLEARVENSRISKMMVLPIEPERMQATMMSLCTLLPVLPEGATICCTQGQKVYVDKRGKIHQSAIKLAPALGHYKPFGWVSTLFS